MILAMENIPSGYSQNVKNLVSKPRQVLSQEMENRLKTKVCMTNFVKEGYVTHSKFGVCAVQKYISFLKTIYQMSCNQRMQH